MAVKDWSTTAADNDTAGDSQFAELQTAGSLNDGCRAMKAEVRAFYEGLDWRDWGLTYTFVSSTSFRVTGAYILVYHAGRRIRATGTLTGTIYGTISSSSFEGGETTVVVSWDSGGSMINDSNLTLSVGISATGLPATQFASGTRILFQQNTAPLGWTEDTTYFNRAIRQTNSSNWEGVSAFVDGFKTVFGSSKATDSYTLQQADIPAHTHFVFNQSAPNNSLAAGQTNSPATQRNSPANDDRYIIGHSGVANCGATSGYGGSGGHAHDISNMDLAYMDVIVAVKD